MTQFSSGKFDKLGDPEPWVVLSPQGRSVTRGSQPFGHSVHAPRPRLDRPLTNPANPILNAMRVSNDANVYWSDLPEWPSREQIDHALLVLRRRAAVFG